jgi:hypothetical protein
MVKNNLKSQRNVTTFFNSPLSSNQGQLSAMRVGWREELKPFKRETTELRKNQCQTQTSE